MFYIIKVPMKASTDINRLNKYNKYTQYNFHLLFYVELKNQQDFIVNNKQK